MNGHNIKNMAAGLFSILSSSLAALFSEEVLRYITLLAGALAGILGTVNIILDIIQKIRNGKEG